MKLVAKHAFDQEKLLAGKQSLGVCFRVTFKWLALQMVGRDFKFGKLNIDSTLRKQNDYSGELLNQVLAPSFDATREADVDRMLDRDLAQARTVIDEWGRSFHDKKGKEFGGVRFAEAAPVTLTRFLQERSRKWKDYSLMLGFYVPQTVAQVRKDLPGRDLGTDPSRMLMTGHVIGLHAESGLVFDANHGEFKLDGKENAAVREIEDHIAREAGRLASQAFRHCVIRLTRG